MIYFMGYTDSESNWTGNFSNAIREELTERQIPYIDLKPYDWYSGYVSKEEYLSIDSKDDDIWFIGWAQSPLIEVIKEKKGKKYGLVVGLTAMPFEPAVLWEGDKDLNEETRLNLYDKIFANSYWCKECILKAYPNLHGRVVVTGFPIDFKIYKSYKKIKKDNKLVVFNQRFALEKLHIVEVELARQLVMKGYKVQHLTGTSPEELAQSSVSIKSLMNTARSVGLEFRYNPSKDAYHQNLAKAAFVITTSIADMLPSSLIEGIYLNAIPLAPRSLCFPEFVHRDNLYTPYDISEIIRIVEDRPYRNHPIEQYDNSMVVKRFLEEMNLI